MNRRQFLGGLGAATLAAAGVAALRAPPGAPPKKSYAGLSLDERRRNRFLNVALTTHEGREVRFYYDLVKGKTVLINFFYTNCVGETLCPMATANLVRVQRLLGKRVGRDIFMYSITLDPEHDTPKVLARYARAFGIRPGWTFLTGEKDDIERLRRNLGFAYADPEIDRDRTQHTGMVRYGIEPLERWAGCPALTRPQWIARYVEWMEPSGARPGRRPQRNAA